MKTKAISLLALSGICGFTVMVQATNQCTPGTYWVETQCPAGFYCPGDGIKYQCPENATCGSSATQPTCKKGYRLMDGKCWSDAASLCCPEGQYSQDGYSECLTCPNGMTSNRCSYGGPEKCFSLVKACSQIETKELQKSLNDMISDIHNKFDEIERKYKQVQPKSVSHGYYVKEQQLLPIYTALIQDMSDLQKDYESDLKIIMTECHKAVKVPGIQSFINSQLKLFNSIFDNKENNIVVCEEGFYAEGLSCLGKQTCPTGYSLEKPKCNGKLETTYLNSSLGPNSQQCYKCTETSSCKAGEYLVGKKCTICPAGYYCKGDKKLACAVGQYCPKGTSEPTTCPDGQYSTNPTNKCQTCPKGSFCKAGKKSTCPKGTYCPEKGTKEPTPCPAGTYNSQTGELKCTTCPTNAISASGATQCTKCTTGLANKGHTACEPCATGNYFNGTNCKACPQNGTCKEGVITCNTGYKKMENSCIKDWRKR